MSARVELCVLLGPTAPASLYPPGEPGDWRFCDAGYGVVDHDRQCQTCPTYHTGRPPAAGFEIPLDLTAPADLPPPDPGEPPAARYRAAEQTAAAAALRERTPATPPSRRVAAIGGDSVACENPNGAWPPACPDPGDWRNERASGSESVVEESAPDLSPPDQSALCIPPCGLCVVYDLETGFVTGIYESTGGGGVPNINILKICNPNDLSEGTGSPVSDPLGG